MAPKVKPVIHPNSKVSNPSGRRLGTAPAIRKMKLRYPELSEAQIAKRVGCSAVNVHNVLSRFLDTNDTAQDLQDYKDNKADVFDAIGLRVLGSITSEDISKASLQQKMIAAAVSVDKSQLLRGQATSINVNVLLDAVNAIRAMREDE